MKRRQLRILRFAATTLLVLAVGIFVSGYFASPWKNHLSLGNSFHIAVWNRGIDSRIVFFNDKGYGPYRGSTIGFSGGQLPHVVGFGDKWGIYYRHIQWPESSLWTLMVSTWYPIAGLAFTTVALVRYSNYSTRKESNNQAVHQSPRTART